jgi:hypothetical protein
VRCGDLRLKLVSGDSRSLPPLIAVLLPRAACVRPGVLSVVIVHGASLMRPQSKIIASDRLTSLHRATLTDGFCGTDDVRWES